MKDLIKLFISKINLIIIEINFINSENTNKNDKESILSNRNKK